jgi:hypothetical protein
VNATETILAIAAVVAAITVIAHFVRKIYFIAKRIEESLGVDAQGRTVTDRLGRIEHQLFPNGGSSLVDKMNRIEADQMVTQGKVEAMERVLESILRKLNKES